MGKSIISNGKTLEEAIQNGLNELHVEREDVNITELKNKKSFFSILAPRKVEVEITVKEKVIEKIIVDKSENVRQTREMGSGALTEEEKKYAKERVDKMLVKLMKHLPDGTVFETNYTNSAKLVVSINNEQNDLQFIIGKNGDQIYSLQYILAIVANKNLDVKIRIMLDIQNHKLKHLQDIQMLTKEKIKRVLETKKSFMFGPMKPSERKMIHELVDKTNGVSSSSYGYEPYRKVLISYKES